MAWVMSCLAVKRSGGLFKGTVCCSVLVCGFRGVDGGVTLGGWGVYWKRDRTIGIYSCGLCFLILAFDVIK